MIKAFILCDLFENVRKKHEANREGSFNNHDLVSGLDYITLTKDVVILQLYWWLFSRTKHCS